MTLKDRLAAAERDIEHSSEQLRRIERGDTYRTKEGDGEWQDATEERREHYTYLVATFTRIAEDLKRRIDAGEVYY